MNVWFWIAAPAWIIIGLTAVARLNDIKRAQRSRRWIIRRIGLGMALIAAVCMLATPFTLSAYLLPEGSWRGTLIAWGFALTWITTPYMPPWHILMTRGDGTPKDVPPVPRSMAGRITGQFQALRDGFTASGSDERRRNERGDRRCGHDRRQSDARRIDPQD